MTTQCASMRPTWTPLNVALMLLGFIFFWPLGLAMLAWILWGDRMREDFDGVKDRLSSINHGSSTGNAAFDAYRARELERLEAERRRLDAERREFSEFMRHLRRAKDQDEFDRFMAEREHAGGEPTPPL